MEDPIKSLNDGQLMRMLTVDSSQCTPEALAIAEAEAVRRGLDLAATEQVNDAVKAKEPGQYLAADKPVVCDQCGNDLFSEKPVLLNTRLLTFFRFDWLDKGATVLICSNCSKILWFAVPPTRK